MPLSKEDYLAFAKECLRWADEAEHADAYEAFLELAQDWTYAAVLAERMEAERRQMNAGAQLPVRLP